MIVTPIPTRLHYLHTSESLDSALVSTTETLDCQGGLPTVVTTETKPRRREKLVQFFPMVEMHETLHVNDYTRDEIAHVWYSEAEFAGMRADQKLALDLFEFGIYTDKDQDCLRGLEARTRWGAKERRYNKELGRAAVFQEQSLQEYDSKYDPEAIARAYASATKHCSVAAAEAGRIDELHASSGRSVPPSYKQPKVVTIRNDKTRIGPLSRIFRLRNKQ